MRRVWTPLVTWLALGACSESTQPDLIPPVYVVRVGVPVLEFDTIGDSVRATATVSNPDPRFPPSFTWTSRDTSVARVSAAGDVLARRNGATWVVVTERGGGSDSARVTVAHRSGLRIAPGSADLVFFGDTVRLTATQTRPIPGQTADFIWTVRDTNVVRVAQSGTVVAMGLGTTTVHVQDQVGGRDSAQVRVSLELASVVVSPSDTIAAATRPMRLRAAPADRNRRRVSLEGRVPRWSSSRGTPVDSISNDGLYFYAWFTPQSPGVDTIRATIDAASAITVLDVRARARITVPSDTIYTGVAASPVEGRFMRIDPIAENDQGPVSFAIEDTTIARITRAAASISDFAPVGFGGGLGSDVLPSPIGLRPGVTALLIRVPGTVTRRIPVRVSPLVVRRDFAAANPVAGRNASFRWRFYEATNGRVMRIEAPVTYDLFSTDTTAVAMPTILGGQLRPGADIYAFFLTADPGRTAHLVLRVSGQPTDSVPVTIRSGSMIYSRYSVALTPTNNERHAAGLSDIVYYQPDRFPAQPTTVRFSRTNPSIATWPESIFVATNELQAWRNIAWKGLKVGTDTIVAWGPGLRGDTLVLTLDSARFGPDSPPASVIAGAPTTIGVSVRNRALVRQPAIEDSIPVDVRSSDPTVLRVEQGRVRVTVSDGRDANSGEVTVTGLRRGTATLTFTSPRPWAGSFTTPPIEVLPNKLRMVLLDRFASRIALGQRQVTNATPVSFTFDAAPTQSEIQLRVTDTTVVTVSPPTFRTGPFVPPANLRFIAGLRTGTAWVVASAPGLEPDSVQVLVGTPRLALSPVRIATDSLTRWSLRAERRDPDGTPRVRSLDSLTVVFESSDTTVATVSPRTLSIPGDFSATRDVQVRFTRVPVAGTPAPRVFIRVRDVSTAAHRHADAVIELDYSSVISTSGRIVPPPDSVAGRAPEGLRPFLRR